MRAIESFKMMEWKWEWKWKRMLEAALIGNPIELIYLLLLFLLNQHAAPELRQRTFVRQLVSLIKIDELVALIEYQQAGAARQSARAKRMISERRRDDTLSKLATIKLSSSKWLTSHQVG